MVQELMPDHVLALPLPIYPLSNSSLLELGIMEASSVSTLTRRLDTVRG